MYTIHCKEDRDTDILYLIPMKNSPSVIYFTLTRVKCSFDVFLSFSFVWIFIFGPHLLCFDVELYVCIYKSKCICLCLCMTGSGCNPMVRTPLALGDVVTR